jgi:amidohydrolase
VKSIENRAYLHQCAEISGHETKTHDFIVKVLQTLNPTNLHQHVGGYGVLAEFEFSKQGKTFLFRADMDAVGSQADRVSHCCGHDGHTAILLDFAAKLKTNPLPGGRVLLLFQPSEENGQGAKAILKSGILQNYAIDLAFALHNIPGFPLGTVLCKPGSFTCAVLSCEMQFSGKTAHASEPEKSISPQRAIFQIVEEIQQLQKNDYSSDDYFLATLVELHIGEETYGVAPGNGVLRWTFRAKTNVLLQQNIQTIESLSKQVVSHTAELDFSIQYLEAFCANENNTSAVELIVKAAKSCGLEVAELKEGFRWGEDFGVLTQVIPGAMFGLGAGENCPPLHAPDYDFPDALIKSGSRMFYEIATHIRSISKSEV